MDELLHQALALASEDRRGELADVMEQIITQAQAAPHPPHLRLESVAVTLRSYYFRPLDVTGWILCGCPGLAITPARTGSETTSLTYYSITHVSSGLRVGSQYTPFDAVNLMAELHTLGVDWTMPKETFDKNDNIPRRAANEIVNRYEAAEDEED